MSGQGVCIANAHTASHLALGILLLAKGRAAEARGWLEEAVAADTELAEAWNGLGVTLLESGDRPGAAQALRRYLPLARGPDRARAEAMLRQLGGS